jgi:hypothetical protein
MNLKNLMLSFYSMISLIQNSRTRTTNLWWKNIRIVVAFGGVGDSKGIRPCWSDGAVLYPKNVLGYLGA